VVNDSLGHDAGDQLLREARIGWSPACGRETRSPVSVVTVHRPAARYRRCRLGGGDADVGMYDAKAGGCARHSVFQATMHTRAVSRLAIESDLRRAIETQQLEVHYQLIIRLRSRRIAGAEALLLA
jgi:hypothetical protein